MADDKNSSFLSENPAHRQHEERPFVGLSDYRNTNAMTSTLAHLRILVVAAMLVGSLALFMYSVSLIENYFGQYEHRAALEVFILYIFPVMYAILWLTAIAFVLLPRTVITQVRCRLELSPCSWQCRRCCRLLLTRFGPSHARTQALWFLGGSLHGLLALAGIPQTIAMISMNFNGLAFGFFFCQCILQLIEIALIVASFHTLYKFRRLRQEQDEVAVGGAVPMRVFASQADAMNV